MSRTLPFADSLLSLGRRMQQLGRGRDALRILGRLSRLCDLPPEVAEETHARLAEIRLAHGQYRRARRHVAAALAHDPASPRYHHLMATALEQDDRADPLRAARFYRRALRLDPEQPRCQAEYGLLALRLGDADKGLAALRRAAELGPDDADVLGLVVEGLCEEGCTEEARGLLLAARFRHARDEQFRRLWNDFRFRQLHEEQEAARRAAPATGLTDAAAMVLPFVRPAGQVVVPGTGRRVRRDPAATLPPPRLTGFARRAGRKQA
jgi:tetratricopeptide (TPR) repeat protein